MFDQIAGLDLLLILAVFCLIVWLAWGLIASRGKIQMKAKVYGRYISLGLILVLLAVAVFQRRSDLSSLTLGLLLGGVLISCVLYAIVPTGFGEKGLYFSGRLYPFETMQYYNVERETDKRFTLRMRSARREFALDFTQEEKPLVLAWMDKGKIQDFKSYVEGNRG